MALQDFIKKFKKNILRFWDSDDSKISIIRDVLVAFVIVFIVLIALWSYTGQWFSAPMVAIESGSMMHIDEPFGRYGTIDAGDMVLLVNVDEKSDVTPFSDKENKYYGKYGDVIIYKPDGSNIRDQIIHRAMCWVEVKNNGSQKTYTINGTSVIDHPADEELYLPELGIRSQDNKPKRVNWDHSGFITKGDNPISNPTCDQIGGISNQPVKLNWISGKARCEIPWIGAINLLFNDIFSGKNTIQNVPKDSKDCLTVLLEVLVLIPVGLDLQTYYKEKKKKLFKISKSKKNESVFNKEKETLVDTNLKQSNLSLLTILIYYWIATSVLIAVSIFIITTTTGFFLHLAIAFFVHIMLLYLVNLECKLINLKNLKLWIMLIALTGPIGITILYLTRFE